MLSFDRPALVSYISHRRRYREDSRTFGDHDERHVRSAGGNELECHLHVVGEEGGIMDEYMQLGKVGRSTDSNSYLHHEEYHEYTSYDLRDGHWP